MAISADKKAIEKEVKEFLDKFASELDGVREKVKKDISSESYREEGDGVEASDDFRMRFLANAPSKNEDCIIAEKKTW